MFTVTVYGLVTSLFYTASPRNISPSNCCNSEMHELILTYFWQTRNT